MHATRIINRNRNFLHQNHSHRLTTTTFSAARVIQVVCTSMSPQSPTYADLLDVAQKAANEGAKVVRAAVDKPRIISFKGATDLVTDTDKASEESILAVIIQQCPDHGILGEEGGVAGNSSSPYLWCVDPLDGTTNFAHGYPAFGVSVTGFGYEHDDAWAANMAMFKEFTDITQGVRRLGAASVDLCHVALGIVEGYWEYRLKPWDTAAGVLIAREAGALVTTMDGLPYNVFERSTMAIAPGVHDHVLQRTKRWTRKLAADGVSFERWYIPDGYLSQMEDAERWDATPNKDMFPEIYQ